MGLFKKKNRAISVVNNEKIYFVELHPKGASRISLSLDLDQFLTGIDSGLIPESIRHASHDVLIVPDYWLENLSFQFQSRKRSIVEGYIERKLRADYPDLPGIEHFFDYTHYKTDKEEKGLYVYFAKEPRFIRLYKQLGKYNLGPSVITAPGLVWAQKLKQMVSGFDQGGSALICLASSGYFIYFFFKGQYLFSRNVHLPDSQIESSDRLRSLVYEINQSRYLFSQKTKSEISRIYLLATDPGHGQVQELTETLGTDVVDLSDLGEGAKKETLGIEHLGPAEHFTAREVSASRQFANLVNKEVKHELEWRPIQTRCIAVGICLLVLLIGQGIFLWKWSLSGDLRLIKSVGMSSSEQKQIFQQYNGALTLLVGETERPSAKESLINIARSLPENVWVKKMTIELEPNRAVYLEGISVAAGPDQLKDSLSALLANLKKHFQGSQSLSMKDIHFETDEMSKNLEYSTYRFKFRFNLP